MAHRTLFSHVLTCDGCGVELGPHDSLVEARAAAYVKGWRFPEKPKASRGGTRPVTDLCSACSGTEVES